MMPSDAFFEALANWEGDRGITEAPTDRVRTSDFVDGWNACARAQLAVLADLKAQLDALIVVRREEER